MAEEGKIGEGSVEEEEGKEEGLPAPWGRAALVTRADVTRLEEAINDIHRLSLGGKTAAQFDAELARTA